MKKLSALPSKLLDDECEVRNMERPRGNVWVISWQEHQRIQRMGELEEVNLTTSQNKCKAFCASNGRDE